MERNFKLISEEQLQQIVEDVSLQYFNKKFVHKAVFNHRLRTTGGRYLLQTHNIEINPKQLIHYGEEALIGIIKHELCHYHLHLEGRGYKHQDHDFKQLLSKVGAPRFCDVVPGTKNKVASTHQYECEKCGQLYNRKRRIDTKRYVCGKCKGRLKKIS